MWVYRPEPYLRDPLRLARTAREATGAAFTLLGGRSEVADGAADIEVAAAETVGSGVLSGAEAAWICAQAEAVGAGVVWPADTRRISWEAHEVFAASGLRVAAPSAASGEDLLRRDASLEAAAAAGVPTPSWRLVSSVTEFLAAFEEFSEAGAEVCFRPATREAVRSAGPVNDPVNGSRIGQGWLPGAGFRVVTTELPQMPHLAGVRGPRVALAEVLMAMETVSRFEPLLVAPYLPAQAATVHVLRDDQGRVAGCVPVFSENPDGAAGWEGVAGQVRVRWIPGQNLLERSRLSELPDPADLVEEPEQVVARAVASYAAATVDELGLPWLSSVSLRAGRGPTSGWVVTGASAGPGPTLAAAAAAGMDLVGALMGLMTGAEVDQVSANVCRDSVAGRTLRAIPAYTTVSS